jgi:hypothetical protein
MVHRRRVSMLLCCDRAWKLPCWFAGMSGTLRPSWFGLIGTQDTIRVHGVWYGHVCWISCGFRAGLQACIWSASWLPDMSHSWRCMGWHERLGHAACSALYGVHLCRHIK